MTDIRDGGRILGRAQLLPSAESPYRMSMATHAPPRSRHHARSSTRPWTRADLARLPDDDNRYEVLNGELLVTPRSNPVHQRIAAELMFRLEPYCTHHGLGVVVGPGAVPFGKNELQPDLQVIPCAPSQLRRGWVRLPRPLLVVEVLSEGSRRFDEGKKRDAYLEQGVADYWIVDPDERSVTVARAGQPDSTRRDRVTWRPGGADEPLTITLPAFFVAALGPAIV